MIHFYWKIWNWQNSYENNLLKKKIILRRNVIAVVSIGHVNILARLMIYVMQRIFGWSNAVIIVVLVHLNLTDLDWLLWNLLNQQCWSWVNIMPLLFVRPCRIWLNMKKKSNFSCLFLSHIWFSHFDTSLCFEPASISAWQACSGSSLRFIKINLNLN